MIDDAGTEKTAIADRETGLGETRPPAPRRSRTWILIPLVLFIALSGLFYERLRSGTNPAEVPSPLINKPVPEFSLPPLEGLANAAGAVPGFSDADLIGSVSVVNIWASWCLPCREEHPILMDLSERDGVRLYGIDYKDGPDNARQFLDGLGNPYVAVGTDDSGRVAIDWGVYGVPETFVVNAGGCITFKHIGPLDERLAAAKLLPAIEAAKASDTVCRSGPDAAKPDGKAKDMGAEFMTTRGVAQKFHRTVPQDDTHERDVCSHCGFVAYQNPKIVVGSVVRTGEGILLCKRAIEPRKGYWTLPAGYLEQHETPEQGARREAFEEACADIRLSDLLAVYTIPRLSQVQLIYRSVLRGSYAPGDESEAVEVYRFGDIPWDNIAFPSVRWALHHDEVIHGGGSGSPFRNPEGQTGDVSTGRSGL